jgi:transposase-like protein
VPRSHQSEFRRKVLDLLKAGRTVTQLANDLQISGQTIYVWRRQEAIDNGELPGVTSTELAELSKARRRIAELETELAIHRRAADLLKEAVPQSPLHGHPNADAYTFGRSSERRRGQPDGTVRSSRRKRAREDWTVTIRDHHEGYISWPRCQPGPRIGRDSL